MEAVVQAEVRDFVLDTLAGPMNTPFDRAQTTDDSPIGSGGIDLESLGLIELILHVEQQYGIKIPDGDIEPLGAMTLGELVADISRRRAAQ